MLVEPGPDPEEQLRARVRGDKTASSVIFLNWPSSSSVSLLGFLLRATGDLFCGPLHLFGDRKMRRRDRVPGNIHRKMLNHRTVPFVDEYSRGSAILSVIKFMDAQQSGILRALSKLLLIKRACLWLTQKQIPPYSPSLSNALAAHSTGACPWKSPVLRFLAR
jgi:hypothetical protein